MNLAIRTQSSEWILQDLYLEATQVVNVHQPILFLAYSAFIRVLCSKPKILHKASWKKEAFTVLAAMTTIRLRFSEQEAIGPIPSTMYKGTYSLTPTELSIPTSVVLSATAASLLLDEPVEKPVKVCVAWYAGGLWKDVSGCE